jgi:hypothetical protein
LRQSKGNPPLPPVIWTENFLDFYIQVPQDPEGDQMYYMIDWGDGTSSGWIGPYNPGETVSISHVWTVEGAYQITVQAKNQNGISNPAVYLLSLSSDSKFFCVTLGYVSLTYFITIHVEGGVYYLFDWGDGNNSDWLGPFDPVMANYVWNFPGEYLLRWKARDLNGSETPWSSVMIKIVSLLPDYNVYIGAGFFREHGGKFGLGWHMTVENTGDTNVTGVMYENETTLTGKVISNGSGPFSITPCMSVSTGGCSFLDLHPIELINLTVQIGNMTYSKSGYEIGPFVLLVS